MGPPSNQALKEGGDTPPFPLCGGWVERARDLDTRRVYREPGKAQGIFTAKAHCLIGSLGCSCSVPVLTPANSHGVLLEDCWQRGKLFLFCAPRRERRPRYVGTRYSPLPFTARAHLAASPLSLCLVIMQSLCAGTVATDQRAFVFDQARAWRASPRAGLGRVLQPQRVGLRLPLLWGGQIGTGRLGLNSLFVYFLQTESASRANPRNNASGCIACFPTIVYRPLLPGVLP